MDTLPVDFGPLVDAARAVMGEFVLGPELAAGAVAAALRARSGRVYTGICLDLHCGIGFCAEHSAAAEMLKHRETEIDAMVALARRGVVPPCGRCRELLLQLSPANVSTRVAVDDATVVTLGSLLPRHWLDAKRARHTGA
ncbi:MAG: hypothetical protein MUF30_01265 [Burkholderiales bacterium]|nr:hypothetical protein [Burkholderiales bacterium]